MKLIAVFLMICTMESFELPLNIQEMDQLLHQLDSLVHSLKREKREDAVATDGAPTTEAQAGQPGAGTGAPAEPTGFAMSVPGMTMVAGCPSFMPQFPGGMNIPGLPGGLNIPGLPGGFGGGSFQISVPKSGFGMNFQGFGENPGPGTPGQGPPPASSPAAAAA